MNTKTKKRLYRVLKIVWFIIGGFIFLWTVFWFFKIYALHDFGSLVAALLFGQGLIILIFFVGITFLFLLIKWIIKKWKKKK